MIKKAIYISCALLVFSSLIFAASAVAAPKYKWKMGAAILEKTESGQGMILMADLIEEYTHGAVKFVNKALSGEICSEKSCVDQLDLKAIEVVEISDGNYGAFSNILRANELPYMYPDVETAGEILSSPVLFELREKIKKQDGRMLLTILTGGSGRHLWSNVPNIRTPEDLRKHNLKVRAVYSPCENESIKAFGAVPTPVPWGELYQALQSKLVNAHLLQTDLCYRYKAYEASPYCTEIYYRASAFLPIFMNLEYWNTLPPEIQGAVLRAAREAQEWCFSNARRYDMQTKPVLQKLGVTFYSLNEEEMEKWKEAALTAWPKLKSQCDQEVLNLLLEAQHKEFPR